MMDGRQIQAAYDENQNQCNARCAECRRKVQAKNNKLKSRFEGASDKALEYYNDKISYIGAGIIMLAVIVLTIVGVCISSRELIIYAWCLLPIGLLILSLVCESFSPAAKELDRRWKENHPNSSCIRCYERTE